MNKKSGISNVVYLWRTYDHYNADRAESPAYRPLNPSSAHTVPIWQVARATSAAPTYFESIKLGNEKHLDGGMGANNPSLHTLREVVSKHGHAPDRVPALFVSIGCGKRTAPNEAQHEVNVQVEPAAIDRGRRKQGLKKWAELGRGWKDFLTDTEGPIGFDGWNNLCDLLKVPRCRFNVEGQMTRIPLDCWIPSTSNGGILERIRIEIDNYLSMDSTQGKLEAMARELVNIRHRRARTVRWERFATEFIYRCSSEECQQHPSTYKSREEFRHHLTSSGIHPRMEDSDLEDKLDSGRELAA